MPEDLFGFGVDPENPDQCPRCKGSGAEPDDPGEFIPEAGMHNPNTAAPCKLLCKLCVGSGKRVKCNCGNALAEEGEGFHTLDCSYFDDKRTVQLVPDDVDPNKMTAQESLQVSAAARPGP